MNDQQEFIQVLATVMGVQSQEELEKGIQALGEEKLKALYEQYQQVKDKGQEGLQLMKQAYEQITGATYAKLGAKLNYIKRLRGECPDGFEMFKEGGCIKCKKKEADAIDDFKKVAKARCGKRFKK